MCRRSIPRWGEASFPEGPINNRRDSVPSRGPTLGDALCKMDAMRFLAILLAFPAAFAQNGSPDGATHADWPHYGGTQFSWRYSALDQINAANVKNLAPAWIFQTGDYAENLQSSPIVVEGTMYLITPRAHVFALDAATGRQLWQYTYSAARTAVAGSEGNFVQNRGLAVGNGKVFFGT